MTVSNAEAVLVILPLLVVFTLLTRAFARHAYLPVLVHNATWGLVLAVLGTDLIRYRDAQLESWAVLLIGLLFFNVGAWATAGKTPAAEGQVPAVGRGATIISPRTLGVLLALYMIGFAVYLATVSRRFGITTLFNAPEEIRGAAGESYLSSVPLWARLLMYIGPVLFAFLLVPGAIEGRIPFLARIVLIMTLAGTMLLLLQRTNIIAGVLLAVAGYLIDSGVARKRAATRRVRGTNRSARSVSRLRHPAVILGAAAVVGLMLFQIVGNALGKTGSAAETRGVASEVLTRTGLTSPVGYMTAGVPAFLLLTESSNKEWPPEGSRVVYGDYNPQTWGTATFEPFTSIIPGIRQWNSVAPFVDVGIPTNVYTFLEPFYRDFRIGGVVIGSLLLGGISTYLYRTRFVSARRYWLSALVLSSLFLVTFVAKVNSTMYVFIALLIALLAAQSRSVDETRRHWHDGSRRGARRGLIGVKS
ncbi:MAG: O-antigen polymerase [Microbacteriaceae bacterium]|uniref:O-antigen polymerase n=1 Tax=Microbacterium gubbeenense TaxID=159896 RepID=UPI003F97BE1F